MKNTKSIITITLSILFLSTAIGQIKTAENLQPATLFAELPKYCPTPDAFDIAPDGSLTFSCPNFASGQSYPGVLMRVSADQKVSKLIELPGTDDGRVARPMGIAYAPDGSLYVCDNRGRNQGRVVHITFKENGNFNLEVVAEGMSQPNGIRYHDGAIYVTQPNLNKLKTSHHVSGLYRFEATDRNIKVNNDRSDANLIYTTETLNKDRTVGLDGLVFNSKGELFVGDFGDGEIIKLTLDIDGKVAEEVVFANTPKESGMDGINVDAEDNIYVAGFCKNQILKVDTSGEVTLIADYPDNDGSNGQIDQPADLIVYNNKLIISNFDLMTIKGMENKKHSKPYTISAIDLKK